MQIPKLIEEQNMLSVLFRLRAQRLWFRAFWFRAPTILEVVNCWVVKLQVWVGVVHGKMLDLFWRK